MDGELSSLNGSKELLIAVSPLISCMCVSFPINPMDYHSATEPSSVRQTGLRQACP
jgi:hypothetical protein